MRRLLPLLVLVCLLLAPASASAHHRDWHGDGNSWSQDGDADNPNWGEADDRDGDEWGGHQSESGEADFDDPEVAAHLEDMRDGKTGEAPLTAPKRPATPDTAPRPRVTQPRATQPRVTQPRRTSPKRPAARTRDPKVPYGRLIASTARRRGAPVALFAGLVQQESNFNARARSHAGASGLTQLMPATARMLGVRSIFDPKQNLDGGARYLSALLKTFRSKRLALAGYNAGPGAVRRYGGVPPYAETRNYVVRVLENERRFSRAGVR